jgi:protein-S-isoprenylcysteine O-methyltransferase Ste14
MSRREIARMKNVLILIAVIVYMTAGIAWPIFRVWRRHGIWPIVFTREAAPAQRLFGWLTRTLFVVLISASIGRIVIDPERLLLWSAPLGVQTIGWLLIVGGTLLTVAAQRQMGASWRVGIDDRPTDLVTGSVFRLVRNPVFTGLLLFLAGYACLTPAWWSITLWAATLAGLRVQVEREEKHLVALHGAAYLAYATRVGRLVPLIGRLQMPLLPSENHCQS